MNASQVSTGFDIIFRERENGRNCFTFPPWIAGKGSRPRTRASPFVPGPGTSPWAPCSGRRPGRTGSPRWSPWPRSPLQGQTQSQCSLSVTFTHSQTLPCLEEGAFHTDGGSVPHVFQHMECSGGVLGQS